MKRKLLVTEDDPLLLALYKNTLESLVDVEVSYAPSLESARIFLATNKYEMALVDLNLTNAHKREGLLILQDIRRSQASRVVMMSSDDDDDTIAECRRCGANAFLSKSQGFARVLPELVRLALKSPPPGPTPAA